MKIYVRIGFLGTNMREGPFYIDGQAKFQPARESISLFETLTRHK